MQIGDIIYVNGFSCLVLDIDGDEVFLWCETGEDSQFGDGATKINYNGSILKQKCDAWAAKSGIPMIERDVDLTTMNGNADYGTITVKAAPLTFDEYRRYAKIIEPHIKDWFWLVTGWYLSHTSDNASSSVCRVYTDGSADYSSYGGSYGLAPAFKMSITHLNKSSLSDYSTTELIGELAKRIMI